MALDPGQNPSLMPTSKFMERKRKKNIWVGKQSWLSKQISFGKQSWIWICEFFDLVQQFRLKKRVERELGKVLRQIDPEAEIVFSSDLEDVRVFVTTAEKHKDEIFQTILDESFVLGDSYRILLTPQVKTKEYYHAIREYNKAHEWVRYCTDEELPEAKAELDFWCDKSHSYRP